MRFVVALLCLVFVALTAWVGYLFVTTGLSDKMVQKGIVLQSLPLLGGLALLVFCIPVLWNCVRLVTTRPPAT